MSAITSSESLPSTSSSAIPPTTCCAMCSSMRPRDKEVNMTTEAAIVSTARTGVGKAYRGALNNTEGPTMAGHVMAEAVRRAGIEPGEVEDVVMGCAMQQGTMVMNVARKGAIRAGLPVTVAGTTIDRQCASGLQAIPVAEASVMLDGAEGAVAGGVASIRL